MIRISQLKLPCGHSRSDLERRIRRELQLSPKDRLRYTISRHSIDARKKPQLFDVYTVDADTGRDIKAEQRLTEKLRTRNKNVSIHESCIYQFPEAGENLLQHRPIVVGTGPAGLFCALLLSENGYRPLVLERGRSVKERVEDIERYWKTGRMNPNSNVQFGEGGAGTFSDGKLSTQVNDKSGRSDLILRTFVQAGAPEDILYESKPHIGTDKLREVIPAVRERIQRAGGEIRFETQLMEILHREGKVCGVRVKKEREEVIPAEVVVLAIGHSARDTIEALYSQGIPMQQKAFAVGFRVSHPQSLINRSQYGISDPKTLERLHLPAASYKLTARASSGRGVYSFCMCPGGYIVNASSEEGRIAVNGMSNYARDSARANSAIVMTVGTQEFGAEDPLAGMRFQRELEERAYELGEQAVPVQRYEDLRAYFYREDVGSGTEETDLSAASAGDMERNRPDHSEDFLSRMANGTSDLCIRGAYHFADLSGLLPRALTHDFIEGMETFDHKIHGFAGPQAYVAGIESRTSSPVRIPRGEDLQSAVRGLYPCGEGAGYAGGIMSAAIDGIRVAEAVRKQYLPWICERQSLTSAPVSQV